MTLATGTTAHFVPSMGIHRAIADIHGPAAEGLQQDIGDAREHRTFGELACRRGPVRLARNVHLPDGRRGLRRVLRDLEHEVADEVVAEKPEPVFEAGNAGLVGVKRQAALAEQGLGTLPRRLRLGFAPGEHDEVVGVAHQPGFRCVEEVIDLVEVEVREQRRERRSLEQATARRPRPDEPQGDQIGESGIPSACLEEIEEGREGIVSKKRATSLSSTQPRLSRRSSMIRATASATPRPGR